MKSGLLKRSRYHMEAMKAAARMYWQGHAEWLRMNPGPECKGYKRRGRE